MANTPKRTVPAENFCATLAANVDNQAMSDGAFRSFVYRTLPIVIYEQTDIELRTSEEPRGLDVSEED